MNLLEEKTLEEKFRALGEGRNFYYILQKNNDSDILFIKR